MSLTYNNITLRSNFPGEVDTPAYVSDLDAVTFPKAKHYQSLLDTGKYEAAESYLNAPSQEDLRKCMSSAKLLNELQDRICAAQLTINARDAKPEVMMQAKKPAYINQNTGKFWIKEIGTDSNGNKYGRLYIRIGENLENSEYSGVKVEPGNRKENSPIGAGSFVTGTNCEAGGENSYAGGNQTIAQGANQTVIGRFNELDSDSKYAFIVGGGTSEDKRANLMSVDWDGNVNVKNNLNMNGGISSQKDIVTDGNINSAKNIIATGNIQADKMISNHCETQHLSGNDLNIGKNNFVVNPDGSIHSKSSVSFSDGDLSYNSTNGLSVNGKISSNELSVKNSITCNTLNATETMSGKNLSISDSINCSRLTSSGLTVNGIISGNQLSTTGEINGNQLSISGKVNTIGNFKFDNNTISNIGTEDRTIIKNEDGHGVILQYDAFRPLDDSSELLDLGTQDARWDNLYLISSPNTTSDRTLKKEITPLNKRYMQFFMLLEPVSFLFKDGTSGRTHIGFIAQDVEKAMKTCGLTDLDFAGFCKDKKTRNITDSNGNEREEKVFDNNGNPSYIYSLRYEEFIAINTYMIQHALHKIDTVEQRLEKIENMLCSL